MCVPVEFKFMPKYSVKNLLLMPYAQLLLKLLKYGFKI